MIKLENVVLASPDQMSFIIEGMRNPMNSWDNSDSSCGKATRETNIQWSDDYFIGTNDANLMQRLSKAGTDHRKFMRMMPVYVRITAPLYWWKEFDTYKVGTVANSCSTMHKIAEKEFTREDFSDDHLIDINTALTNHITIKEYPYLRELTPIDILNDTISMLNKLRKLYLIWDWVDDEEKSILGTHGFLTKKDIWWQMIQLLPSSYNQTRNVMMNYETLANIYKSRKDHKLDEWREFCKWIETLPYSELITGGFKNEQI